MLPLFFHCDFKAPKYQQGHMTCILSHLPRCILYIIICIILIAISIYIYKSHTHVCYIYMYIYVSFMIIQRWKLTLPPARMKSFMAWSLMVTWLRLQKAATNLERRTLWDRFWQCGWGRPCGWRSWWRHRACMLIYSDTLIYFGQMSCWLSMIIPIIDELSGVSGTPQTIQWS